MEMQENYTKHIGILKRSESFLECADIIKNNIEHSATHSLYPIPLYYLYAHALELALKSYIDFFCQDEKKLRTIGHDIEKILASATDYKIEEVFEPNDTFNAIVICLNPIYKEKSLEYHRSGLWQQPDPTAVSKQINNLVASLNEHYWTRLKKLNFKPLSR